MTESRMAVVWRCANCERGVHEDEAMHWKPTDDIVCPKCYDELAEEFVEAPDES